MLKRGRGGGGEGGDQGEEYDRSYKWRFCRRLGSGFV